MARRLPEPSEAASTIVRAQSGSHRQPSLTEAGAILTIDLGAIRANYRLLAGIAAPAECAGVVKADAYGLADGIAYALAQEGCRSFFVAHVAEGRHLRRVLPDARIFVLNGVPPGAEADCLRDFLVPVLNSVEQIEAWKAQARRSSQRLAAALQVDSGMARLGLPPRDVERIARDLGALEGIEVVLVMSHFASADEPDSAANAAQLAEFVRLRAMLPQAPASLANSSGLFLGEGTRFDLVRPGAALYGINPVPGRANPMRPVVRLDAKVIQTRRVEAGDGVGYGHRFIAPRAMTLATIGLGYADGWHRHATSAGFVNGVALPFVGRVSMDSIILDASALPEGRLKAGDLVELIGPHQSIDDVAAQAGTIGYEILTSLGGRFHRIYKDDAP